MNIWMGTTDVAFKLHCSPERVRQLEAEGKITAERTVSGKRIFRSEDVERLVQERESAKQQKAVRAA